MDRTLKSYKQIQESRLSANFSTPGTTLYTEQLTSPTRRFNPKPISPLHQNRVLPRQAHHPFLLPSHGLLHPQVPPKLTGGSPGESVRLHASAFGENGHLDRLKEL